MKKFLALLLSVLMLLTLTAAFAEEATPVTTQASFSKKYVNAIPVGETLTFKTEFVINQTTNKTDAPATAILPAEIKLTVTEDEDGVFEVPFEVTAPEEYGTYIYKITEVKGSNENVEYDVDPLYVGVLYTADGLTVSLVNYTAAVTTDLEVSDRTADASGDGKKDQFVNTYDVGTVEITKTITGNAANMEDRFVVVVKFTASENLDGLVMTWHSSLEDEGIKHPVNIDALVAGKTATFNVEIGHGESIFFDMIPAGVQVQVEEIKQVGKDDLNYYVVSYDVDTVTATSSGSQTINITNTKETAIPTGVELDSIPYIVLMAVAVLGAVAFIVKRRMAAADED